jgi:D-3-phosphoglycerate dehydrogenase
MEADMPKTVDALILDLLEWIGPTPRAYAEIMEAWRTSCPRLPVWEEANARGYVERHHEAGKAATVSVSASGQKFLARHRRRHAASVLSSAN